MFQKLIPLAMLGAVLSLLTSAAAGQVPPVPPPGCPDPTGVVHQVVINGVYQENEGFEFFPDGTWEDWVGDELIGWGTYEFDPEACTIDYVNLSGDGGGNQTGTYTWDSVLNEWERTASSHPNAPPMSLVPPL